MWQKHKNSSVSINDAWEGATSTSLGELTYWSWDVDGVPVPDCYENCQRATAQPQIWVSLGSEPSWILALLKGWGSHLFLHPDQHSGTRRDRCSGHIPDGHFGDSLGLLGPSSPKREVAMHMKDAQNLASWHQERGLGLQPVLPTELAARPPSLRCNHTGQVWNLHWPQCQLRERHWMHRYTHLEMAFGLSLGDTVKSLRNQAFVLFQKLSKFKYSFLSCLGEREGSSGRELVSLESFSSWIHKVPASPGWGSLSKGTFLLTSFPSATRMVPRKAWWQWLEQAAKVGHSSAAYPLSFKGEFYASFTPDLSVAHPPRPWDLIGKNKLRCDTTVSQCSWRELFLFDGIK